MLRKKLFKMKGAGAGSSETTRLSTAVVKMSMVFGFQ
jgi:hypothetical protein